MKKKITEKTRLLAAAGFVFMSASCIYVYFSGIDKSILTLATSALCLAVALYEVKRVSESKSQKTENKKR